MPIVDPKNDTDCLSKMHAATREFMGTERCREIAKQFEKIDDLTEYIRALDQRNDCGDPRDGPRIQCDVSQRLRLPADDPACFERTALFLGVSQHIDPDLEVTSATIRVDNGLHTFPIIIRDGRLEVVILDPRKQHLRNAMTAGAYRVRNASPMTAANIGPWFADIVQHGCVADGIADTYQCAIADIRNGFTTGQPLTCVDAIEDVLAVGRREAELFGAAGRVAYRRMHDSVRNLSIKLNRKTVSKYLDSLMDTAEPLTSEFIKAALIAQFGPAAHLALHGIDLGVRATKTKNKSKKPTPKQAKNKRLTRAQRRRLIRRMTLAYRNP